MTGVQIGQQWLLPTTTTPATGVPAQLRLEGDQVVAIPAQATGSLTTGFLTTGGPDGVDGTLYSSPPSLALPDGRVAAWHNDHLILAYPFGGIATP
jgi:hypothetical protein